MSAPTLMILASFLFATMGVCIKLATAHYSTPEIVMYRGLVGALMMALYTRWHAVPLRTPVPLMHLWRSVVGVSALTLWFFAISGLPLATAMTLNYMSSIWMALFLIGGAVLLGGTKVDGRLISTVLLGFVGVAAILRPTMEREQAWFGVVGLLSGMLSAMAYLQVTALGRVGEPEGRVVFYFSLGGATAGLVMSLLSGGLHPHWEGAHWLLAVGLTATTAQLLMTRAYAIGKPLVNASLQYLGIAFSYGYGVLVFDDRVTWLALGGMVLVVLAGIAAASLRQRRQPPSDSQLPDIEP
ncbi:MAG: DMT family transporter [Leptothrix sp. (in: b-proteobacteria)]